MQFLMKILWLEKPRKKFMAAIFVVDLVIIRLDKEKHKGVNNQG